MVGGYKQYQVIVCFIQYIQRPSNPFGWRFLRLFLRRLDIRFVDPIGTTHPNELILTQIANLTQVEKLKLYFYIRSNIASNSDIGIILYTGRP